MFFKKIIPTQIKQFIIKRNVRLKGNKVHFGKHVIISRNTQFEGLNVLNDNTEFTSSYLGLASYIANNCIIRNTKTGRFCAIGDNVRTGLGLHPTKDYVSIHPAFYSLQRQAGFTFVKEQLFEEHRYIDRDRKYCVEICNDVWIGNNVLVMDGVRIGDGAVVAAGAIVTNDVEPYTIVGGIPAKPIKKRFNDEQIEKLIGIKWWEWDINKLKEKHREFVDIETFVNGKCL